jgi:molecular chaperone GrpE
MSEDTSDPGDVAPSSSDSTGADGAGDNGDSGDTDNGGVLIEVDASDSPAAKIAALEAKVAAISQEKKDLWEKFVRSAADLENFRKRAKRDLEDAKADARTRVLKEMLPVADNLERAVAHATGDTASVLEGVRLVLRQFTHAFERSEVTAIEAETKPFDPNLHEAIGQQESDAPPGTVVSVLQRGYKLGDRLLRPSLVVVAKPKAVPAPAEPADEAPAAADEPPPASGDAE